MGSACKVIYVISHGGTTLSEQRDNAQRASHQRPASRGRCAPRAQVRAQRLGDARSASTHRQQRARVSVRARPCYPSAARAALARTGSARALASPALRAHIPF